MRKTWSRIGGILGIAAILFAQVATASHACSMIAPASVTGHSAANLDAVPPDVDNLGLCQKHCEDGGQSVNKSSSGSPPVAFVAAFVAALDLPMTSVPSRVVTPATYLRSTAPPLSIRNCCFRN